LPESRVDRLGEREGKGRLTDDTTPLSSGWLLDFFGVRIVSCFGLPETGRAFARGLLGHLPGRGGFLANVGVHRRKNALGEAFLAAVLLVAATQWGGQQQESEKL
jgi:hypothetical protein